MKNPTDIFKEFVAREADKRTGMLRPGSGVDLDTVGIWKVLGEDASANHTQEVGIYEGTLANVLSFACEQPRFYGYGPGVIRQIEVVKIDSMSAEVVRGLREQEEALKAQLAQVQGQLGRFTK